MGNMLLTSKELEALGEDPITSTYNIDRQMEKVLMTREQREAERKKEDAQKQADKEANAAAAAETIFIVDATKKIIPATEPNIKGTFLDDIYTGFVSTAIGKELWNKYIKSSTDIICITISNQFNDEKIGIAYTLRTTKPGQLTDLYGKLTDVGEGFENFENVTVENEVDKRIHLISFNQKRLYLDNFDKSEALFHEIKAHIDIPLSFLPTEISGKEQHLLYGSFTISTNWSNESINSQKPVGMYLQQYVEQNKKNMQKERIDELLKLLSK